MPATCPSIPDFPKSPARCNHPAKPAVMFARDALHSTAARSPARGGLWLTERVARGSQGQGPAPFQGPIECVGGVHAGLAPCRREPTGALSTAADLLLSHRGRSPNHLQLQPARAPTQTARAQVRGVSSSFALEHSPARGSPACPRRAPAASRAHWGRVHTAGICSTFHPPAPPQLFFPKENAVCWQKGGFPAGVRCTEVGRAALCCLCCVCSRETELHTRGGRIFCPSS